MIHRDDLPMDVAEQITKDLQEQFPGIKVQFLGDHQGEIPKEVQQALAAFENDNMRSLAEGRCIDCDVQIPDYDWLIQSNAPPPEGWEMFWDASEENKPMAWQCPKCAQEDAQEDNE